MPASTISAMLPKLGLSTVGSKYQMIGSASTTTSAVNSTMMATFESLKKRSTRYLSKCTEMAHSTGPQKAKKSQEGARDSAHSPVARWPSAWLAWRSDGGSTCKSMTQT